MRIALAAGIAAASIALLGLTACAPAGPATDDSAPPAVDTDAPVDGSGVSLATAESELGTIVVDGDGMTIYQFDSDTQGGDASTCSGACAANWPAVPGGDGAPELDGITGEVGTITGIDGEPQLTLNGWPLYYFAGDSAPGDVNGQGVNGVWWVLTPAGERITDDGSDSTGGAY